MDRELVAYTYRNEKCIQKLSRKLEGKYDVAVC